MNNENNFNDIIISTRVRLARNLSEFPFPCKLQNQQRTDVINKIKNAALNCKTLGKYLFKFIDINNLNRTEAISLVERHIASPELISSRNKNGLIISQDGSVSIMVCEEDHLRIQVMKDGLRLDEVYEIADEIDSALDKELSFAFDDKLGYLTQCPTNIGTGMRASLMMHLPAMRESGTIQRISEDLSKLGLTIRGIYGEGSEPKGDIYQLSNQITLGISERAAIENLKNISFQLIKKERQSRIEMAKNINVEDTILRSYGILKSAKLISNDEFMKLISNVRFGVSTGIINDISYDDINKLITMLQPATLMKNLGEHMDEIERDKQRAKLLQDKLLS